MGRGYPNPSGTWMRFNFSSPLGMSRITGKDMRIGYENGECKTRPHPASLSCLIGTLYAEESHRNMDYSITFSTNDFIFFEGALMKFLKTPFVIYDNY